MEDLWKFCGIFSVHFVNKNKELSHHRDMCGSSLFEFFTVVLACG